LIISDEFQSRKVRRCGVMVAGRFGVPQRSLRSKLMTSVFLARSSAFLSVLCGSSCGINRGGAQGNAEVRFGPDKTAPCPPRFLRAGSVS